MQRSSKAAKFLEVYQHELDEVVRRRREAGFPVDGTDEEARRKVADELVGLALSGGGVRSASLNLGLIQSMYRSGLLKDVDYLSTVSGGGYVGACLSSAALAPETRFSWQKAACKENAKTDDAVLRDQDAVEDDAERGFELAVKPDGRQPKRVNELIHSGTSLRRPLVFLNRYLIGIVLTNIVVLSGIFTLCAAAAFLFRCTDYPSVINWLYALGFRGDIMRAFFPATMFFAMWLLLWAISYWRKGAEATGRVARIFLAFTLVSVLMAIAMLVGTGDVSLNYVRDNWGIEPPKEAIESIGRDLQKLFFVALVIALLPYLRVKDLIRSGTRPRNVFEGWIFAVASRALLYGLPLLVFGFFARENISGFNERRMGQRHDVAVSHRSDIRPLDFKDWRGTWRAIELQSSAVNGHEISPADGQSYAVGRRMWQLAGEVDARRSIQVVDDMAQFDSEYGYTQRWLLLVGQLVSGEENPLTEQYNRRQEYFGLRYRITQELTDGLLCSPQAFQLFTHARDDFPGASHERSDQLEHGLGALLADGEQLEDRVRHLESRYEVTLEQWLSGEPLPIDLSTEVREQYARTEEELKDANWHMLRAYFGDQLTPKSTIYAANVLVPDQSTRLVWFLSSLSVFVVSGLLVNLNATSLHGFYRNGISKVWIDEVPGFGESIPLTRLDTTSRGAPYHLINATVHLMGSRVDLDQPTTDSFLFSRCYCGSKRTGFSATDEYGNGRYDLPNAIAVSGAAVTPTQAHNPLLAVLLFLSNSRLGQWLPNPAHKDRFADRVHSRLQLPFSPIRLLIGLFQRAELRNHCFVADGGHHENLGLEALLERRVKTIVVSDVTCDSDYQFEDLVRLHRRIGAQLGIRIEGLEPPDHFLDLSPLVPDKETRHSETHVICARIHYPRLAYLGDYGEPLEGLLVYVKPGLTGDESLDLRSHHAHYPTFPHDSTADQFYDPDRFESYRQLGFHLGEQLAVTFREHRPRDSESPAECGEPDSAGDGQSKDGEEADPDPPGSARSPSPEGSDNSAVEGSGPSIDGDVGFLKERLRHENLEFQMLAVHAMGELVPSLSGANLEECAGALGSVLERTDADKHLLEKTIWALGEFPEIPEPMVERLIDFIDKHPRDVKLRAAVLETVWRKTPHSQPTRDSLSRLLESSSRTIRQKTRQLLEETVEP